MNNNQKTALLFALVIPIPLLIEYIVQDYHLTLAQGVKAIFLQAIPLFITQRILRAVVNSQAKPQAKK